MPQAKNGDNVKVHYIGRLDDGTVFDSSAGREPLEFKVGSGEVIPGFEQAVVGMQPGETRSTLIRADDAYGPYHEEMVALIPREQLPPDFDVQVGEQIGLQDENGNRVLATVVDVSEAGITIDGNHPLAGEDLQFDIQLVEIVGAPPSILIARR